MPMICNSDSCFFTFVPSHLNFVLDFKACCLTVVLAFFPRHIPHSQLDRPRKTFLPVVRNIYKFHGLAPISMFGRGAREDFLAPALRAAVQMVAPIVGRELVGATVERINPSIFDTVSGTTNGLRKEGGVTVQFLIRE